MRSAGEGEIVEVVLDRTPLYAESGGQDSDAGIITADGLDLEVLDVQKVARKLWVHQVRVRGGEVAEGQPVLAQVDPEWRLGARQGHSGTHVVHAALRQVLGPKALQSGSYNKPGYLRLDFAWQGGLSPETRSEIEEVANLAVRQDLPVRVVYTTHARRRRSWARSRCSARPTTRPCASWRSAARGRGSCAVARTSSTRRRSGRSRCSASRRSGPVCGASRRYVGIEAFQLPGQGTRAGAEPGRPR